MKKIQCLKELKDQVIKQYNIRVVNGGTVGHYRCPHCKLNILTDVPHDKTEVWDALVTCYECSEVNYIVQKKTNVQAYKYSV